LKLVDGVDAAIIEAIVKILRQRSAKVGNLSPVGRDYTDTRPFIGVLNGRRIFQKFKNSDNDFNLDIVTDSGFVISFCRSKLRRVDKKDRRCNI
jgi:hypothetical protein